MKNLFFTTALMMLCVALFGQEVKVSTDKEKYKFDDIIEVTFELNAKSDSIHTPDFEGFKLIAKPYKSTSLSIQDGERVDTEWRTYRLRPVESGHLQINSPIHFCDGKRIEGIPANITIDAHNLTAEELKEKEILEFIKDRNKPNGTTRIIFHEEKGYIEIFGEMEWQFYGIMTAEEIEQIKRIK